MKALTINTIPSDREFLDVSEVMEVLGMKRSQVMSLIRTNALMGHKVGTMFWVTVESVKEIYQSLGTYKG